MYGHRSKQWIAFLAGFFLLSLPAYAFEGSFKQTMSLNDKMIAQFNVTAKGKNVKMDILNTPQPETVIENQEGYFRIFPKRQMAIKMPRVERRNFLDDLGDFKGYLDNNHAEKAGEEKVGNVDTEVYDYVDPMSQQKAKAWLTKDSHLPLRIQVPTPQGLLKVEFADYSTGKSVEDNVFIVPEGIQIMDQQKLMAAASASASQAMQQSPSASVSPSATPSPSISEKK